MKSNLLVSCLLVISAVGGLTGFVLMGVQQNTSHKKEKTVAVNVASAFVSQVPIEIRTIGNVTPFSVVNVTPQVNGQLSRVAFKQGQNVKKGDLLFEIDPRPYQAAYNQALGNVAKDRAQVEAAEANTARDIAQIGQLQATLKKDTAALTYANTQKRRYIELVNEGAVSHEQADGMTNNAAQAQATIQADQKAIENAQAVVRADRAQIETAKGTLAADLGVAENARIQLGWTKIYSPIDGRAGSLNVYEGNNVTSTSNIALVTIAQVTPIYVTANIPEQYLRDVRRAHESKTLKLQAMIGGEKANAVEGTISFMENTVNTSTGTIMMRASFGNADGHLYPGQFVDVVLTMPPAGDSVVVPTRAVQPTQQGQSVWVLQPGGTVAMVPVKVGQARGDLTAITSGITTGAMVVTDGQMNLVPGCKVQVVQERQAKS